MFVAYARYPDGRTEALSSVDDLAAAMAGEVALLWADIEEPAESDLKILGSALNLNEEALEDCLHGDQRPRIDEFDNHVFLVLYGLLGPGDDPESAPRKLAVFYGPRFLVTVHREPVKTVHALRDRFKRNPAQLLSRGTDSLLYSIIDAMVDNYLVVIEGYETRLEALEEASLDPAVDDTVLAESAALRRKLLDVRRLSVSYRELLAPIAQGSLDYISEALESRFGHVTDHLAHVTDMAEILRERLEGVRDHYHTAVANRTNAIMKTLTIIATILLPLTFIAGVYGMNLPLWPPPEHPLSFWGVIGVMLVIAGTLLIYFRLKKWL